MAVSTVKQAPTNLTTRWYNTATNTSILTNIPTNGAFALIGIILDSGAVVGCGKRFSTSSFITNSTSLREQDGYVLFDPQATHTRIMMLVYLADSTGL